MWKLKAVLCCGSGKRKSQLSGEIQKTESRVKVWLDFFQGIVTGNCSDHLLCLSSPLPSSFFGEGRGTIGVCVSVQYFHFLDQILHESQKQVLLEHSIYFKRNYSMTQFSLPQGL